MKKFVINALLLIFGFGVVMSILLNFLVPREIIPLERLIISPFFLVGAYVVIFGALAIVGFVFYTITAFIIGRGSVKRYYKMKEQEAAEYEENKKRKDLIKQYMYEHEAEIQEYVEKNLQK